MRTLRRLVLAASFVGLTASAGFAQQGQITTGGGQTTGSIGGTGGLAGGGQAGQLGGSSLGGISLQTMQTAPTISAPTATTGGSGSADPIFGGYYANPYYQGMLANATASPGGFGTALGGNSVSGSTGGASGGGVGMRTTNTAARTGASAYGTTGTAGRTGTTATAGRTGTTGAAGALGGRGGVNNLSANQAAVVVPLTVQITYPAVPQFQTPRMAAPQVQTDVSGMIARSALSNPAGVQATVDAANTVTLRGNVADAAEARLVEGMVRLTPGVVGIRNELTFPVASAPTFPVVPGTTFLTPVPGGGAPVFPRP